MERQLVNSSVLIVVRTHYIDFELSEFAAMLQKSGWPLVFVVDEGKGDVAGTENITKVSLNAATLSAEGLFYKPDAQNAIGDIGWRCGDYALYAARKAFPNYSHYLLIEPDVRIKTKDIASFFHRLGDKTDTDLLACNLRPAEDRWFWAKSMIPFGQPIWRCIFSFIWMSAAAIDFALSRRLELSRLALTDDTIAANWPNDEAFIATTLCNANFSCQDFFSLEVPLYSPQTLSFHRPFSRVLLENAAPDEKIYHPVLSGARFLRKADNLLAVAGARKKLSSYSMFTADFDIALRAECGEAVSEDFKRRVEEQLRSFGKSRKALTRFLFLRKIYHKIRRSAE